MSSLWFRTTFAQASGMLAEDVAPPPAGRRRWQGLGGGGGGGGGAWWGHGWEDQSAAVRARLFRGCRLAQEKARCPSPPHTPPCLTFAPRRVLCSGRPC